MLRDVLPLRNSYLFVLQYLLRDYCCYNKVKWKLETIEIVAGTTYKFVQNLLDQHTIGDCSECGRGPFHEDYQEFGNLIVEATGKVGALYLGAAALKPVIATTEVPIKFTAGLLKRTGYDDYASEVNKYSNLETALEQIDQSVADEEVAWTEHNGEPVCYLCRRDMGI